MKKSSLNFITIFVSSALILAGCSLNSDEDGYSIFKNQSGNLVSASEVTSSHYSSEPIEVNHSTATLTIDGLSSGKTIWMTKTNPSGKPTDYPRYVTSASGINLASGNISSSGSTGGGIIDWITDFLGGNGSEQSPIPCLTAQLNANLAQSLNESSARSAAAVSEPLKSVTQINPVENSTTKEIYVDTNQAMTTYAKQNATLRAKGTNCYVWVIDKYYGTPTDNGQIIDSTIATNIAKTFDEIYPMVRQVFGNESDKMIYQTADGKTYIDTEGMSKFSDTGPKVNIVVYDIASDYKAGQSGGTVGYFYAKDYYYQVNNGAAAYSNSGKYFYIDAYFAANKTEMVYSTLAHEFQHMVDFGVKTLDTNGKNSSSSWYNEMKSMLCEDIMKNYFKSKFSDKFSDEDSPFSRLPMFCRHYYDIGLEYDKNTPGVYYSYANNYAFGAWAARNYGGVSFIKDIATNPYVDVESITDASGEDIEKMLKKFSAACIINKENYGFNQSPASKITYSEGSNPYSYPLDKVNLWELDAILPKTAAQHNAQVPGGISNYYSFKGPVYFGYKDEQSLRPYGIVLAKIGTAQGTSVTINFNTSGIDDAQRTYIIIQ